MLDMQMLTAQSRVQSRNPVDYTNKHPRPKLTKLIKIESRKQTVTPTKSRMSVNNHIIKFTRPVYDILNNAPTKRMQPLQWYVKYTPRRYIRSLRIHHLTNIENRKPATTLIR
jgi:hypothetical protein